MRSFVVSFIVALVLLGGLCVWLWKSAKDLPSGSLARQAGEALQQKETELPARGPMDYHVLQGQGGIPLVEAQKAGLTTSEHAYLQALEPIMASEGVSQTGGINVRGLHYDLCWAFASATRDESQYLEYNLTAGWDELHFGFGFEDSHPSDPEGKWQIELSIDGDGKELFAPQTISPVDKPIFAMVDVSGVNRLTFNVRRVGYVNPFKPILLDAFLLKGNAQADSTAGNSE